MTVSVEPIFEGLERKGEVVVRVVFGTMTLFLNDEDMRRLNAVRATHYRRKKDRKVVKLKPPCMTIDPPPEPPQPPRVA